ncbi:MAG: TonB-dependent receptor [Pseudomonadota bacterium]
MTYNKLLQNTAIAGCVGGFIATGALAETAVAVDIPAQDLGDALAELGTETGLRIAADADAVAGKQSPTVSGTMTPSEALERLLAGTELSMRSVGRSGAVVTRNLATQDVLDDEPVELGTLVLEGELIQRTIQDSQTSAAVVTGQDLEERSDADVQDTFNRTANAVTNGFNPAIRGIQSTGPSGTGRGQTITTTVDGARISNFSDLNTVNYSTWDLEQIDILRGPQSTQTGRNALAGSVTVRSQDPVFFQEGKARLRYGNGETGQAAIAVNTPLVEDVLAFRFSAERFITSGFVDNVTLGTNDADAFERTTIRAGLRFEPSDRFSAILKYTFAEDDGSLFSIDRGPWPDERSISVDYPGGYAKTQRSWNLEMGYEISETLTLESFSNYTELDTSFEFDAENTAIDGGILGRFGSNTSFEQEIRLRYQTNRINSVAGVFYTEIEQPDRTAGTSPASLLPLPFPVPPTAELVITGSGDSTTINRAIFGEVEYAVTPRFRIIAGASYDIEEISSEAEASIEVIGAGPDPIPIPQPLDPGTDTEFEAFLPKLGFVYDIDDRQSIGFIFQQGYRAGGSRTNLGTVPFEPYTFDPEFTDNYEISYRSAWYDGTLIVNANAFYINWRDQQVTVAQSATPNDFIITNAGSSRLWGAELDIQATPSDDLVVFGNVGYVNTEFTEFEAATGDLSGNEFPFAPEWTGAIGGTYLFDNGWSVGGEVTYTGESFSDIENDPDNRNDAYWLTNLRASKSFDNGLVLTAYIDNAFDQNYTLSKFEDSVTPGPPREFGIFGQMSF